MQKIIALLTDFGTRDWYVASMKAVCLRKAPSARFIDITHEIEPGDVAAGAFLLAQTHHEFPTGTVFLGVVDPGVGTRRDPVAVRCGGKFYVGPDNGLYSLAAAENYDVLRIDSAEILPEKISHTFHGRDIFAPAAAHLASDKPFEALGSQLVKLNTLPELAAKYLEEHAAGEICYFDRFGNAITTLQREKVEKQIRSVAIDKQPHPLPLVETFSSVPPAEPLAYWGSGGRLEIGVNGANAQQQLSLKLGQRVTLLFA